MVVYVETKSQPLIRKSAGDRNNHVSDFEFVIHSGDATLESPPTELSTVEPKPLTSSVDCSNAGAICSRARCCAAPRMQSCSSLSVSDGWTRMFATLIFQIDRSCMPDKPAKQMRTSHSKLCDCELRSCVRPSRWAQSGQVVVTRFG